MRGRKGEKANLFARQLEEEREGEAQPDQRQREAGVLSWQTRWWVVWVEVVGEEECK